MSGRRGVTLLESVLAIALLAGAITTVVSSYAGVRRLNLMQQQRLNAHEVAHRLILIYMNQGPSALPRDSQRIEQGRSEYRFRLSEEILLDDNDGEFVSGEMNELKARPVSAVTVNKRIASGLVMITFTVYPFEDTPLVDRSTELASVSRVFYPLDTSNMTQANPDSVLLDHVRNLIGLDGVGP